MTTCAFNCNKCFPNNGPHVCRNCKGQNIHISDDCPKIKRMDSSTPGIIKRGIGRTVRGLPPIVCFFCKAENLHHPFDCPRKDTINIDKKPCVFDCDLCDKKPLKGPHVCDYCNAKNLHRSNKCPKAPKSALDKANEIFAHLNIEYY